MVGQGRQRELVDGTNDEEAKGQVQQVELAEGLRLWCHSRRRRALVGLCP
jgi:hypothetical protein